MLGRDIMRPKQPFQDRYSAHAAQAYLVRKCNSGEEYLERGGKTDQAFATAIAKFRFDDEQTMDIDLRNFSRLCMDHLNDAQWFKLRTAIRVKRKKDSADLVSIDISSDAHQALKRLASLVGSDLSMSQAILALEQKFGR